MIGPRFFPEALAEYEDAVVYYETCEEGLGARLIQEVDEAIALAMEFPDAAPTVKEAPAEYGLRWIGPPRFPIKLVFAVRADQFLVVALFHARRRPGYWLARLEQLPL